MPFLHIDGARLHYRTDGNSANPCVVFSNSLGTDLSMWDAQIEQFIDHFNLLRFDTRGHGLSAIPDAPFTVADIGSDVIALLNQLQISKASFCGLSMGGMLGQWLALNAADRFCCFALSSTAAKIGTAETWNQRIDTVMSKGMGAVVPSILERWYTATFRQKSPKIVEQTAKMLLSTDPRAYALNCAAVRDLDLRTSVHKIRTPTLVVYGTEDPVTPVSDAEFLVGRIPDASRLALRAAHLSNVEAADDFSRGVLDFLLHFQRTQTDD